MNNYRHTLFYCALFYYNLQIQYFLKIEDLWQSSIKQVTWHHFSNSICSFCVSVMFGNSWNILLFHYYYICCGDLWPVVFEITIITRGIMNTTQLWKQPVHNAPEKEGCKMEMGKIKNIVLELGTSLYSVLDNKC